MSFENCRVLHLEQRGDFTCIQSVHQMTKNQSVPRFKPLAEGGENVSGGHLREHRFLTNRMPHQFIKAVARTGIFSRDLRQAELAFSFP